MTTKTERSHCHFVVKENHGRPEVIVEPYHNTVSTLHNSVLGFTLLGGTTLEQAKKIAAGLNENVLDVWRAGSSFLTPANQMQNRLCQPHSRETQER